jgi:hypothetical protein
MKYDLSHLIQQSDQNVFGLIQDDEALFLYSVIRTMRLKTVVEVGVSTGYSATNFLAAVGEGGHVIGIDVNPTPKLSENHTIIIKDVGLVDPEEIPWEIDLVFYDCHNFDSSMFFHKKMTESGKITFNTVLALHDTNVHPYKTLDHCYEVPEGWVHVVAERSMVNELHKEGWDAVCLHTKRSAHGKDLPFRHGVTIMKKFSNLEL